MEQSFPFMASLECPKCFGFHCISDSCIGGTYSEVYSVEILRGKDQVFKASVPFSVLSVVLPAFMFIFHTLNDK